MICGGEGEGEGEGEGDGVGNAADFNLSSFFFFCSSNCTNDENAGQLLIKYSYVPSIEITAPFPPLVALFPSSFFSSEISTATEEEEAPEEEAAARSGVAEVMDTFSGGRAAAIPAEKEEFSGAVDAWGTGWRGSRNNMRSH